MKNAIIVHGMPSKQEYLATPGYDASQTHWTQWLKRELEARGYRVDAPEMPAPYQPVYEKWAEVFESLPLSEDTILVGHSCGGGFLVRWLSENKVRVGQVVLVAPWIDPHNKHAPHMFGDMQIDEAVASRTQGITELISTDDDVEEQETLAILQQKIKGLEVRTFTDKGHFCVPEIPEVLEVLKPSL